MTLDLRGVNVRKIMGMFLWPLSRHMAAVNLAETVVDNDG